jgi:AraC-like DNA-binding protein
MIDPANQNYPRKLHLPPPGRPRWVSPPNVAMPLVYLSWGRRFFGRNPIPVSRHPGWVYVLVQSGRPQLWLPRQHVPIKPGQMLLIHPDCPSGWRDEPKGEVKMLTWTWRDQPSCADCQPAARGYRQWTLDHVRCREAMRLHAATRREIERPDHFTPLAVSHIQTQLDVLLLRSSVARPAISDAALRLELAHRWMAENVSAHEPISGLCEYLQVSPATLVRLFRRHMQQTPQEYHQQLRLSQAKEWLQTGRLSVKEVSYRLGYRHPQDLTRAFTRWAGCSPTACRPRSGLRR